jgi:predicted HicB family RNase H-like nuclease
LQKYKSADGATTSRCIKRLSLQVSQQLHREAKLAAIEDEETINSMVVSLIRRHLKERKKAIESSQRRGSRLNHGIY